MNDDANADKRRARLRAMRERYEQSPENFTKTAPVVKEPMIGGRPGRMGNRSGRPERVDGKERSEQSKGGGPLQRLIQFLMEPSPGGSFVPGTQIGEQRLRQAVNWLEQRSRTAQGGAGERIQRLLRFLKQDIPGEPMMAGVNLKRLQQLMERAGTAPTPPAPSAPGGHFEAGDADRAVQPPPLVTREPAMAAAPQSIPVGAETRSTDEIAVIEDTLRRLRDITQDLELRLEQARRQGTPPSDHAAAPRRSGETAGAAHIEGDDVRTSSDLRAQAGSMTRPPPEGDDWFLEFLE